MGRVWEVTWSPGTLSLLTCMDSLINNQFGAPYQINIQFIYVLLLNRRLPLRYSYHTKPYPTIAFSIFFWLNSENLTPDIYFLRYVSAAFRTRACSNSNVCYCSTYKRNQESAIRIAVFLLVEQLFIINASFIHFIETPPEGSSLVYLYRFVGKPRAFVNF